MTPPKYDWWDQLTGPDGNPPPNLSRILVGKTIDVTVDRDERTVTIARVQTVNVGIDARGIFTGIHILDDNGDEWVLYSDGSISDHLGDRHAGWHRITTLPAVAV